MNTIITASVAGLPSGGGSDAQTLRQGANQTPIPKVWAQHISTVLASQLKPVTLVRVVGQGPNNNTLSVSHYGPCPEVPDGQALVGIVPLIAGTQTKDDFGLPIAGAPAENQKLLQYQTAPGDPYALGISSKSPDGVTSPAIPNSGDVTPGTAASNPTAYLTGPVTKQHPWITDVVMIWGLDQLAYGDYDYTDPSGTVHPSLGKGDTKVKKPGLSPRRATNTTPLYSGQLTLPDSSPTQYLHSGLRRANDTGGNDGVGVLTQWGTNIDKDDAVDVWLAASHSQPAVGTGDQTARPLPCYEGDSYNMSALGVDGGDSGHALYVKIDGTSITQDSQGRLKATAGGGGAGAALLATNMFRQVIAGDVVAGIASGTMTWNTPPSGSNADFDTGTYFDPAHPTRLTVQVDGIYELSGQIELRTNVAGDAFTGYAQLNKNGADIAGIDLIASGISSSNPTAQADTSVTISIPIQCVAGDYFQLKWFLKPGTLGAWVNGSSSWFSIKPVG